MALEPVLDALGHDACGVACYEAALLMGFETGDQPRTHTLTRHACADWTAYPQ